MKSLAGTNAFASTVVISPMVGLLSLGSRIVKRPFDRSDVELLHLEEGARDALPLFLCSICKHLAHDSRCDLPRDAVLILQPTTLLGGRIGGKRTPAAVNLLLGIAQNQE